MSELIKMTPMRGFAASVSRGEAADTMTISSFAVGIDRTVPGDEAVVLCLRHADGTMLTGYLDRFQFARMGQILDECVGGSAPGTYTGVVQ